MMQKDVWTASGEVASGVCLSGDGQLVWEMSKGMSTFDYWSGLRCCKELKSPGLVLGICTVNSRILRCCFWVTLPFCVTPLL